MLYICVVYVVYLNVYCSSCCSCCLKLLLLLVVLVSLLMMREGNVSRRNQSMSPSHRQTQSTVGNRKIILKEMTFSSAVIPSIFQPYTPHHTHHLPISLLYRAPPVHIFIPNRPCTAITPPPLPLSLPSPPNPP